VLPFEFGIDVPNPDVDPTIPPAPITAITNAANIEVFFIASNLVFCYI
jgi:hypothetical protein